MIHLLLLLHTYCSISYTCVLSITTLLIIIILIIVSTFVCFLATWIFSNLLLLPLKNIYSMFHGSPNNFAFDIRELPTSFERPSIYAYALNVVFCVTRMGKKIVNVWLGNLLKNLPPPLHKYLPCQLSICLHSKEVSYQLWKNIFIKVYPLKKVILCVEKKPVV